MDLVTAPGTSHLPKMEQVMEHRQTGSRIIHAGSSAIITLLLLAFSFIFYLPDISWAEGDIRENVVLPQSGIKYPGGYDLNTVGEIKGIVQKITIPENGPVQLHVLTNRETYTVLASSGWYWKDFAADIREGMDISVRGSKALGADGNLYLIAERIRTLKADKTIVLRDEEGYPAWVGSKTGMSGKKAGFGSPSGGGGVRIGGPGGAGRGRR
jgi:hypothetical protein